MKTTSTPLVEQQGFRNERHIGSVVMQKEYEILIESINKIEDLIVSFFNQDFHSTKPLVPHKEWMTLAEAAKYSGVSHNTFSKFRILGLKVSEIDGIKRVSRKEIDSFLESNSY